MYEIKELQSIKDIFNIFKNLGVQHLIEDEKLHARKIEELMKDLEVKCELLDVLNEKISELEEQITGKDVIDKLDVEMIRTKTQIKKIEKNIKKLESLNTSRIKVDATENDKIRFQKVLSKLTITKRLLEILINKDDKVLISGSEGSFKVLQLNKNNSKDANSEILWNNIKQSSPYANEWAALFNNKKT